MGSSRGQLARGAYNVLQEQYACHVSVVTSIVSRRTVMCSEAGVSAMDA